MRKKYLIIGLVSLVAVGAVGGGAFYFVHNRNKPENQPARPVNTVDYGPPKKEDSAGVSSSKDKASQDQQNKPGNAGATNTGGSSNVSVVITQSAQSGDQFIIRALVNGTTSGTCNLTLSKSGQTITRSAAINAQANYAICQGFNIPLSDFPSGGQWKVSITATVNGAASAAAETTGTVQK